MLRKLLSAIVLIACTSFSATTFANHLMGGSLTYKDNGITGSKHRYTITLKLYRDCSGSGSALPTNPPPRVGIYKQNPKDPNNLTKDMASPGFASLPLQGTIKKIPPITPTPNCTYTPSGVCIEEGIYEGTVDLDTAGSFGYHIIYENYARNININNVQVNPPIGMAFYAYIPSTKIVNSTPYFTSPPVSFFCTNNTIGFYNTAIDPDGDSLSYQLVTPYEGYASSVDPAPAPTYSFPIPLVTYNPGYTSQDVFGSFGTSSINSSNGVSQFYCNNTGFYVIVVEVSEYRKGVLLSKIRRDLQLIVDGNCPPNPPPKLDKTKPGVSDTLYVDEGSSACFPLEYVDSGGDSIYVSYSGDVLDSSKTNPHPVITGATKGKGTLQNTLCWSTRCGQGRKDPYTFVATAKDNGCPSYTVPISITIFVRKPTPKISGPADVCVGTTKNYSASGGQGGSSFYWRTSVGTASGSSGSNIDVTFNQPGNGNVILLETNVSGCKSDSIDYPVVSHALPTASISGKAAICKGDTTLLTGTATGVSPLSYLWSGGSTATGPAIMVNPSSTTTYGFQVTDKYCTSNPAAFTLKVNPLPVLSTFVNPDNKCPGLPVNITASGASTYKWAKSSNPLVLISASNPLVVTPTVTTQYIVTGTDTNSCKSSIQATVNVLPPCTVSISALPNDTICLHQAVTLTGSGSAVRYRWVDATHPSDTLGFGQNFTYDTSLLTALPATNPMRFTVYAWDNNNCFAASTISIYIEPLPIVKAYKDRDSICPNTGVRLVAHGAFKYYWKEISNASFTSTPVDSIYFVTPSVTTTYVVMGDDGTRYSCMGYDTIRVYVRPSPPVLIFTPKDSICKGKSVILTASGAKFYSWHILGKPDTLSIASNLLVMPTASTTYLLRGRDGFGCPNTYKKLIYVRSLPTLIATSTPDTICPGSESVLRVKGAKDYLWSTTKVPDFYLSADSIFHVQPVTSTTYLVKGTDRYGCEGFDSSRVSVKKKPPVRSILGSPYVCPGLLGVPYKVSDSLPGSPVSTSTFAWTVTRGTPSSGQLLTTDSLRVDFSSVPGTAQVKVVETNQQGCQGDTLYFSVEIKSIFNPPPPRGQDSICTRDTAGQVYHTPYNTPGSVYQWHILGGSIKSGNTTHQVTVNWNTTGLRSGRIWYEERSNTATANCYGLSDTLFVSIFPTPVTGPVQGKLSVCIGEKNLPYSVAVNNSSTFTWTAKGGVIKSGNGTSVITVDWDTIPGPHYLKVLQRGSQGKCPGDTVYATVTVNPTPVVASIEGPGIVCPSKINGLVYYVKGSTPTSTYLWKITGGSIASGAGKDTIRVNWDADFSTKSKVYQLEVTELTQAGCVSLIKIRRISLDGSYPSLDAVSTGLYNDREMEISWPQSYTLGQLSKYSLYRKAAVDSAWQLIAAGLLKNGYTDKSVSTHQLVYQYRYTTKDACGDSSTSRPQNSMVLGAAVSSSGQSILLSWNLYRNWDSGLQKYEVWRKLDNAVDYSFYQAGDTTSRFTVTSTSEGFVQCYRIKAIENGGRNVSWSNDTCLVFTHPVEVPTAFSPNGDGVNDTWVIRSIESYPNASVEVFNRWGEKVYSSQSYTGWNGTSNGKDLPDGTYFYVIRLRKVVDNKQEAISGNVTIMR